MKTKSRKKTFKKSLRVRKKTKKNMKNIFWGGEIDNSITPFYISNADFYIGHSI